MEVELSNVENLFWRNGDSVGLLLKINGHIFLNSFYYVTKDSIDNCDLGNAIFSHIISLRHIFKKFLNIKCVFWFTLQPLFEASILRRTEQGIIINEHTSSGKVSVIVVRFLLKINFFNTFFKKYWNINF
jgi:hypothetical protein